MVVVNVSDRAGRARFGTKPRASMESAQSPQIARLKQQRRWVQFAASGRGHGRTTVQSKWGEQHLGHRTCSWNDMLSVGSVTWIRIPECPR